MSRDEIRQLLAIVASYDNRKVGTSMVEAWHETARRCRWTYAEAAEAVHAHYAEQTAYVMPGAITDRIRSARRYSRPALPTRSNPPASAEHRARMRSWVATQLGWRRDQGGDPA
jgi:hypothetical protein